MTARKNLGFTLIELLLVIGILGLLIVVILVAINPVQNLAKTRDAGRVSSVNQLGHASEAYAASHTGNYVNAAATGCTGTNWVGCLVDAGEISITPAPVNYSISGTSACTAGGAGSQVVNGWCYKTLAAGATNNGPIIAYARLESKSKISLCPAPATDAAWVVYSSADGRGGTVCTAGAATEPAIPAASPYTFGTGCAATAYTCFKD